MTTYTYAAAGPETITQTINASQSRQFSFEYTALGQLKKIVDPRLKETELGYTAVGDLDWSEDPLDDVTNFGYDLMGRRKKTRLPVTTPANDSPTTTYDTLGRVWRVTNPNGSYWEYKYDGAGHRKSVRDPEGNLTNYHYDDWGRLTKVVDALSGETQFGYDLMSNLTSLTDANGHPSTAFEYDGYHRLKKVTYPGPRVEQFTYTGTGQLETRTDRKGVVATYTYDALNRLKQKTYSNGSPPVLFSYDANGDKGFLTYAQNGADTLTWDYDLAGQLSSESSSRNASTVSYEYDLAGNRTKVRLNGQEVISSTYDDLSRPATTTRPGAGTFTFGYDAASRRTSLAYPNGVATSYGYDLLSQVSSIRSLNGASVVQQLGYLYNDLGNRFEITRAESGTTHSFNLEYDALSRLTWVWELFPPICGEEFCQPVQPIPREHYTYDPVGNRLTALGVPSTTYSDRNELLDYGGVNITYDLNGSQSTRSRSLDWTYVWNVENQLAQVLEGTTEITGFEYDPMGRRVGKTAGANEFDYVYDGEDILVERMGPLDFTFVHGPGVDEPLLKDPGSGPRSYFHADALGTLTRKTDGVGALTASPAYDTFGRAPALANGYSFTGREWDAETRLYYYRARYYDPEIGRFISEDPVNDSDGQSGYPYVASNPALFTDPSGMVAAATCGGPCPPRVQAGRMRLCSAANQITNFEVRKCVLRKCGFYPRPIQMTCDSSGCGSTGGSGSGHNTGRWLVPGVPQTNSIVICTSFRSPNPSLCMQQRIAHEMLHSCRTGGPAVGSGPGWTEAKMRDMHLSVPCN